MINWNVCKCLFVNFFLNFLGKNEKMYCFMKWIFFKKKRKFVMKGEFNDMISFFRVVGY